MNDKERSEDIDLLVEYLYSDKVGLREFVRDSLEQDERVQELEEVLEQDPRQEVLEGLYEENKRYRKVLEFYADRDMERINLVEDDGFLAQVALLDESSRMNSFYLPNIETTKEGRAIEMLVSYSEDEKYKKALKDVHRHLKARGLHKEEVIYMDGIFRKSKWRDKYDCFP